MCTPDIPEVEPIDPIISLDGNAKKTARVKTNAGQAKNGASRQTGSQQLRGAPPKKKTTNTLFSLLQRLNGGAGGVAGLQIGGLPPKVQ